MDVYYKATNGRFYSRSDIETAFYITTGATKEESEMEFRKWLRGVRGNTIIGTYKANEVPISDCLAACQVVLATKLYQQRRKCSVAEAKQAIFAMMAESIKKGSENNA